MAEYQLTATDAVIRTADQAHIPADMANRDYNGNSESPGYLQWKESGGVPDPYVEPPPPEPAPDQSTQVAYDHENRIRVLEGQPPLSLADFAKKAKG